MKKSKFTEAQVAAALRECASGTPIGQVAHKLGVSEQTLYTWKKKYASLDTSDFRKLRQLEEENTKLKRKPLTNHPGAASRRHATSRAWDFRRSFYSAWLVGVSRPCSRAQRSGTSSAMHRMGHPPSSFPRTSMR